MPDPVKPRPCKVAVIWIDWYAYHVARFRGMYENESLRGRVRGIELVGGVGVHKGLKFREDLPADLPIETLMPASGWREAGQLRLALKLWSALDRIDPGAVLVPGYYTLPAIAAAVWARLHRRTGILMTESTAGDHARSRWKEALKGALIRALFDWAICGGEAHRQYLRQLGFPADRIASSYDVVDNAFFAEHAAQLRERGTPPEGLPENYFLYVGRLSPEKNIEELIEAYLSYRKSGGDWSLVVVGAGPSEDSLRRLAGGSTYSSDIHFKGMRSYRELPSFYSFARAFVLPSTREPWGLVVNEAMASGVPAIVSDRCGCAMSLIEHNSNGFIFQPGVEGSLKECLRTMSSLPQKQLITFSNSAVEKIGNFSPRDLGLQVQNIVAETTRQGINCKEHINRPNNR